jgi:hypothetical protein
MTVGFTGTRTGLSMRQSMLLQQVFNWLTKAGATTLLYGTHEAVALAADAEARDTAEKLGWEARPMYAAKGTELERDRELVKLASVLVAGPENDKEQLRSGTWATIRYARVRGIPIIMLPR